MLYKTQIRPSLEYSSHIWGAATLFILDAVQRRSIRLIGDPALTCPAFHQRDVDDLSPLYRYSNGFCSSVLTSIIPLLSKPARCTRGTSSSHSKVVVLHTSRTEQYDRTFLPRVSRAWNGLLGDVLIRLFKSRVNKLPLTEPSHSSPGIVVFRTCPRGLLGRIYTVSKMRRAVLKKIKSMMITKIRKVG
nr:unnamed protein product [Callosobruchus chinensis]